MDEYAKNELEKANDALSDAHKLRDVGGTDEAIVNRLYTAGRKPLYGFADTAWRIRTNSYDR